MAHSGQQLRLFDAAGSSVYVSDRGKTVIDKETGEEMDIQVVTKPYYGKEHFWKLFFADFFAAMGFLDSKQVDVVMYIIRNTSPYDNQFRGLQRNIAEACHCSEPTVRRVIKKMINANLMTKTEIKGVYMLNPDVLVQGSSAKQRGLLIQYRESRDPDVVAEAIEQGFAKELPDIDGEVIDE